MKPLKKDETPLDGPVIQDYVDIYNLPLEEYPIEHEIIYVIDREGRYVGSIRRKTLRYLVNSNNLWKMSSIVNHFEDAAVAVDKEGRIFYATKNYTTILGIPLGKIIGKDLRMIESEAALIQVLEGQKPIIKEKTYIKSLDKYVSVRMFPLFTEGIFQGAVSVFKDITETNKLSNELKRVSEEVQEYKSQLNARAALLDLNIIGSDPGFTRTLSQALTVAKTDATVLIRGENGTGKEVIARLIQNCSARKDKPFITVNCAAIPESLIESELFGYEDGAFTGAKKGGKVGKFELANGGTLFLDEIGDMPIPMQSKLLRVLQDNEIEKIGKSQNITVDVRIIAATNQPLEEMINNKTFRKDLYYRLNVITLDIPPLRDRPHDCLLLINHFLSQFNEKYNKNLVIENPCVDTLLQYDWPGNVRELKSCVEHAVILCSSDKITTSDLPTSITSDKLSQTANIPIDIVPILPLRECMDKYEKELLVNALAKTEGNKSEAMKQLGLTRRTFYRKLNQFNIK